MNSPLSRHLTRFTADVVGAVLAMEPLVVTEPQVTLAVSDLEMRLHQAHAQARAEAAGEADRTIAQMKADHEQAIADAIATARSEWTESQVAIEASCRAALDELRDLVCSRVVDILQPVLADTVTARALSSLSEAIDRLVADPAHPVLTIRGPADLIAALRASRGESPGLLYEEAATAEIKMTADGALVETKLCAALAMLRAPTTGSETDA